MAGTDEHWRRFIDSIVRQHRAYLRSGVFVCEDYRPDFVDYLRSKVHDLGCASAAEAPLPAA